LKHARDSFLNFLLIIIFIVFTGLHVICKALWF
jgi:hypothetical protein